MATPALRTVLVTGCSSGIGLAVAVRLAQDPQQRYQGEERGGDPSTLSQETPVDPRPHGCPGKEGTGALRHGAVAWGGCGIWGPTAPCSPRPSSPGNSFPPSQPPGLEIPWPQARRHPPPQRTEASLCPPQPTALPVIATMRDLRKKEKLEEAAGSALGKTLSIQRLDVCSDSSVAECMGNIPGGRVDVLVNNAGVGQVGPVESISVEEMKRIFETNFFGAVRMIKPVSPDMKRRQSAIVVISSVMGLQGIVFNDVYAASKFAVEGFCESLAVQLLQFNVFVSMVEPGPVNTDFELKLMEEVSHSEFPGTDPATVRYFKDVYLPASHEIFATLGQSPAAVAEAIVNVIGARRPAFRTQTNASYTPLVALKYADPSGDLSVRTYYRLLFDYGTLFHPQHGRPAVASPAAASDVGSPRSERGHPKAGGRGLRLRPRTPQHRLQQDGRTAPAAETCPPGFPVPETEMGGGSPSRMGSRWG
ncbi:LOW QUALITY PROTEIN: retinol dehydrogenase 8 [Ciconia maguari]